MLVPLLPLFAALPAAHAWGAAGHEIVATIAQIHLRPSVRAALCDILPPQAKCHLAPIAAWADQVRMRYPGSGPMHYINGRDDHPADVCYFGEHGWVDEDVNVLTAISNMTAQVVQGKGDIPVRFLTHFMGDMHQPLHLTGRDKGGNGAMFLFEGRHRNLHSVWDSGILTKNIRELSNYTSPVPSKQIESSLPGAIFDPYVRFIVYEGLRVWWRDSIPTWLSCPASGDPYPHSTVSSIPASNAYLNALKSLTSSALGVLPLPATWSSFLADTLPLQAVQGFADQLLAAHPDAVAAQRMAASGADGSSSSSAAAAGSGGDAQSHTATDALPVCPYTWAKDMHGINCAYAWPKEYTGERGAPLIELDTDAYLGALARDNVLERVLAMGGLRLAHALNFALGGEGGVYVDY